MKRLSKRDRETIAEMVEAGRLGRLAAEIVAETHRQHPVLATNIRQISEVLNRRPGEMLTVELSERDWRIVRLALVRLFRSLDAYRDIVVSDKA